MKRKRCIKCNKKFLQISKFSGMKINKYCYKCREDQ